MSFGFRDGHRLKVLLYLVCSDFDGYGVLVEAYVESDRLEVFPN